MSGQANVFQRHLRARIARLVVIACCVTAMSNCVVLMCLANDKKVDGASSNNPLESVDRKIGKEPTYATTPRYALLVLGADAKTKVWMVEDGDVLYVDKNANGDLTDDGPAISQSSVRNLQGLDTTNTDCEYKLDAITPSKEIKHTDFLLRRWKYGKGNVEYGLSLSLNDKTPMYAGWFGTFWAASPTAVPLMHFGGALTPSKLSQKEFVLNSPPAQLDIGFVNKGLGKGAMTYLSIEALPKEIVPEVRIDWPVASDSTPVRTVERLTERCCYWNYYKKDLQIPQGVVEGEALLTFVIPTGEMPLALATKQIRVPVRNKSGK